MNRFYFVGLLLVLASGCNSALMHELQPHRLYRLNRGPAPGKGALYSVPCKTQPTDRSAGCQPAA